MHTKFKHIFFKLGIVYTLGTSVRGIRDKTYCYFEQIV